MSVVEPEPITDADRAPFLMRPEVLLDGTCARPAALFTAVDARAACPGRARGLVVEQGARPPGRNSHGRPTSRSHRGHGAAARCRRLSPPARGLSCPTPSVRTPSRQPPWTSGSISIGNDDWLVLGGIVMGRPRLRTQLPSVRAVAQIHRPVALRADTMLVDVDRLRASILWRGWMGLSSEAELSSVRVTAGLETWLRSILCRRFRWTSTRRCVRSSACFPSGRPPS